MSDQTKKIFLAVAAMLLFPLGFTALISGRDAVTVKKQMDMEAYIPMLLCQEIPWDYEEEMLKAQAVLIRSSLYLRLEEKTVDEEQQKEQLADFQKEQEKEAYQQAYRRMEKAVRATKGQVMTYQGKVCPGVFHRVSAGATRDGSEALPGEEAGFLKSVESSQDVRSEEYLHGHYFTEESLRSRLQECYPELSLGDGPLMEQLAVEQRDRQEYVLRFRLGSLEVAGEELREKLQLSSSNFTVQMLDGKIRFLCKGLGHGLGLSQYGGNELAKQGYSYQQILFSYFPDVVLRTVNSFEKIV